MRKIPIRINPVFFILAGLIGALGTNFNFILTIVWMVVILVSVLVHELGHALTALFFKQRVVVHLTAFGGLTKRHGPNLKLWQDFLIVLNGPLAGISLAAFAYFLFNLIPENTQPLTKYALQVALVINIFWTVINIIPVHPLDGGRMMSIVLEAIFGFRGTKISFLLSLILCAVFGLLFFAMNFMILGILFFLLTFENYQSWQQAKSMGVTDKDFTLWHQLKVAENAIQAGEIDEAMALLEHLRRVTKDGMIYVASTQFMASIKEKEGELKQAFELLKSIKDRLSLEYIRLLQSVAYKTGHFQEAVDAGVIAYQENPDYKVALINALAHSKLSEVNPAIGWLQSAYNQGCPNLLDVLKQSEFDSIRGDKRFKSLVEKASSLP